MKHFSIPVLLLTAVMQLSCTPKLPEPVEGAITLAASGEVVLSANGGSSDVSFAANKDWSAAADAEWLQVEPRSGSAGENLKVTVTAGANEKAEERSATLTLTCENDVKTVAVKQSAADAPENPENPENPEDPENPGVPETPYSWPNDTDAFDFGLDPGESRTGKYLSDVLAEHGVSGSGNRKLEGPILMDGITYGGPGMTYYGNRMTVDKVNKDWSEEYPDVVPSKSYFSFKINRPGHVRFFQSLANGVDRVPSYYLALVATKDGVTTARLIDELTPDKVTDVRPGNPNSDEYQDYFVSLYVKESDLKGITTAATVYLFHRWTSGNTCSVHYYPLTWISSEENEPAPDRKTKILLAGDSTCTQYGEASAPQTGWGQCLADYLGENAKVENHAVGGESTKSFIESGKWKNLLVGVFSDDLVLIQFGHNDQKTVETHHTDPETTYKQYLSQMVSEVRERGGRPVLITSVCRRQFDSNGNLRRSHGDYPKAMRELAAATGTPLIDIEEQTFQWLSELGPEGSVPYYVMDKRDPSAMDNTHLTREGAQAIAEMIAKGLRDLGLWK